LEEKKLVTTIGRLRSAKQADRHVISASILSPEEQELLASNNPEGQEDTEVDVPEERDNDNPVPLVNDPNRQDFNNPDFGGHNPAMQDETLTV
jgi:hypothetical protein